MAVFFHANFGLNRKYMAGLLKAALRKPGARDKELAKPFGYGAPFASKYRAWLHVTGLANQGFPVQLTEMGKVVWEKDQGLRHPNTLWFMHHELASDTERAESWHFFVKEFLGKPRQFTQDDLTEALMKKLMPHSKKHFGPGSTMIPVIVRKLLECYTADHALGQLGLVADEGGGAYRAMNIKKKGPWTAAQKLRRAY